MTLKETLTTYQIATVEDIPSLTIENYTFFYCTMYGTFRKIKEALGIQLNKSLISKNDFKLIKKAFRPYGKIYWDNISLKHDFLLIQFYKNSNLIEKLNVFVSVLKDLSYSCRDKCIVCGANSSFKCYHSLLVRIHPACIKKLEEATKVDMTLNSPKNTFMSYLFSILGSLISLLPVILIYAITKYYVIVLTFLVPVGTFIGFNYGKSSRFVHTDIINLLISFFAITLFDCIYIFIAIQANHFSSFADYYAVYTENFYMVIFQSLLFYVLGTISSFLFLKNKSIERSKMIQ